MSSKNLGENSSVGQKCFKDLALPQQCIVQGQNGQRLFCGINYNLLKENE